MNRSAVLKSSKVVAAAATIIAPPALTAQTAAAYAGAPPAAPIDQSWSVDASAAAPQVATVAAQGLPLISCYFDGLAYKNGAGTNRYMYNTVSVDCVEYGGFEQMIYAKATGRNYKADDGVVFAHQSYVEARNSGFNPSYLVCGEGCDNLNYSWWTYNMHYHVSEMVGATVNMSCDSASLNYWNCQDDGFWYSGETRRVGY